MKGRSLIVLSSHVAILLLIGVTILLKSERKKSPADTTSERPGQKQYVLDDDTAILKKEFEAAWIPHVVGYTNYTTAGMANDYGDMMAFVKQWKPKILRNQVYKEPDTKIREKMVDWMVKEDSIASLYYGMLIPHGELMARWKAYEDVVNLPARIDGVDLQFKDGRATWMSRDYENCEMTALIRRSFVWSRGEEDVYAFVLTDISANINDTSGGVQSDALQDYWLIRYRNGRFDSSWKLPYKDVAWMPCMEYAPYGRKYTLVFRDGKAEVENCVTGEVVLSVEE